MSRSALVAARRGMRTYRSLLWLLPLGAVVAATACNAQVAHVLETPDGGGGGGDGTSSSSSSGSSGTDPSSDAGVYPPDCAKKGGVCLPTGEKAAPTYRQAGPGEAICAGGDVCWLPVQTNPGGPVCFNDQGCNDDPIVSSLWGTCFDGICVCKPGFTVQPNGKCAKTMAPMCLNQGGACFQQPATCPTGELAGDPSTNMSCGDFIAAVCCFGEGKCKPAVVEVPGGGWTPSPFHCCTAGNADGPPICVNGWQTCAPGDTAKRIGIGCL